jgi:tRNA(Ile)-lysidine synthase
VIQQLLNHTDRHKLCKTTDKILLAVSGGIDSMVMLDLFLKAGFSIAVAHCNFQLRGKDSDADEQLVKDVCGNSVPFFSKRFETSSYAEANKLSIQMAARQLRYDFFESLMNEKGFLFTATAHQLNDSLETTLLNFVRGSGVEGMAGIPVKTNRIIRPLLFATRQMISDYASENKIVWREDASNASDDYQRNFLRNKIIPSLKEINPSLEETFRNTNERLQAAASWTKNLAADFLNYDEAGRIIIHKKELKEVAASSVLLWEIIKDFDFNYEQCKEIIEVHQPGKIFYSSSHVLTVDRETYIIQARQSENFFSQCEIQPKQVVTKNFNGSLFIQEIKKEDFSLNRSQHLAQIDADKVEFPLVWRLWKQGDSFMPFGMSQHKKLSDFFIDLKVSLPDKEKITVIESGGQIVWVVGFRIHDAFKVTENTKRVLVMEYR